MVPINNTTMEGELLKWLPQGSSCRTIKIPRGAGLLTRETVPAYKAKALELAREFAKDDLDAIVYGCTSGSFFPETFTSTAFAAPRFTTCETISPASKEKFTSGWFSANFFRSVSWRAPIRGRPEGRRRAAQAARRLGHS